MSPKVPIYKERPWGYTDRNPSRGSCTPGNGGSGLLTSPGDHLRSNSKAARTFDVSSPGRRGNQSDVYLIRGINQGHLFLERQLGGEGHTAYTGGSVEM